MTSSVLTNTSAMIALQNLRSTNSELSDINNQISTGKKVASAKDNAAVFAISAVMESDVTGFKAIQESLSLGASTLAVASNGTQQIDDILNEIKGKVVAANEENVDRATLQNEIVQLRDQITGIVSAAQFNGLNLLQSTEDISILSSLDRASSGEVTTSSISVTGRDFGTGAGTAGALASGKNASLSGTGTTAGTDTAELTSSASFLSDAADTYRVTVDGVEIDATLANLEAAGTIAVGAAAASDEDVANYIAGVINGTNTAGPSLGFAGVVATVTDNGGNAEITVTSNSSEDVTLASSVVDNTGGNVAETTAIAPTTLSATTATTNTAANVTVDLATSFANAAGNELTITVGDESFTYTAAGNDTNVAGTVTNAVADFTQALSDRGIDDLAFTANGTEIVVSNLNSTEAREVTVDASGLAGGGAGADVTQDAPEVQAATAGQVDIGISSSGQPILEGDSFSVTIGNTTSTYVAGENEDVNDVIRGLQNVIAADGPANAVTSLSFAADPSTGTATLSISSETGAGVALTEARGGTEGTGDLYGLSRLDVTTAEGAEKALTTIENLIQTNIDAQASFGASERRIEIQSDFMSSLVDSFKSGIGSLVDADLEEASARLQALQVQQQLGIQSLSIANQAPQNILALFR